MIVDTLAKYYTIIRTNALNTEPYLINPKAILWKSQTIAIYIPVTSRAIRLL